LRLSANRDALYQHMIPCGYVIYIDDKSYVVDIVGKQLLQARDAILRQIITLGKHLVAQLKNLLRLDECCRVVIELCIQALGLLICPVRIKNEKADCKYYKNKWKNCSVHPVRDRKLKTSHTIIR